MEKSTPHILHAPGMEKWTKYTCTGKSTANLSPPGFFLGKVRTGHNIMRWMHVLVRVLFISQIQIVAVGKSEVTTTKHNEHSLPRDRGNLMSIKRFRSGLTSFDPFCCAWYNQCRQRNFAPQDTQECAWCSIGCGGRAAAAAAAFGSTTTFLSFFLTLY